MKKQDVIKVIKDCAEIFRHAPFCLYWSLYDYTLTAYRKLFRKEYVGIYVKIISPSERKLLFLKENVGGGLCGFTVIKIFFDKKWFATESCCDLLNHEVLHQVLRKHVSYDACKALDRVHTCYIFVRKDKKIRVALIDFID